MTEKKFNNSLLTLNYWEGANNGPPLLLLHGIGARWQSFLNFIPYIEKHFHVYALDLRGHGKSDRGQAYKLEDYVPDILSFINDKIEEPTIVLGNSFGGMIGILAAANNTELVKALIIGDSLISKASIEKFSSNNKDTIAFVRNLAKESSIEEIILALKNRPIPVRNQVELIPAYKVLGENSPHFRFLAKTIYQLDPEVLTANLEGFEDTYREYRTEILFPKIQCPVLLLQANPKLGGLMEDNEVEKAMLSLPKPTYVKIHNVGHFSLMVEDLDAVTKAVFSFIESALVSLN